MSHHIPNTCFAIKHIYVEVAARSHFLPLTKASVDIFTSVLVKFVTNLKIFLIISTPTNFSRRVLITGSTIHNSSTYELGCEGVECWIVAMFFT